MLLGLYGNFWDYWSLYHPVTFDGVAKRIIVNPDVTAVDVKTGIYSAWKQWVMLEENSKYAQAMRSIGGDPVGPGLYAGDIYFLMNGWKLYVDHEVAVSGVIYSEDGSNPFITPASANVVRTSASNLVLSYGSTSAEQAVMASIEARLTDLTDEAFGRWVLNFAGDTLTLYRANGSVFKVFNLVRSGDTPPNYVERMPA